MTNNAKVIVKEFERIDDDPKAMASFLSSITFDKEEFEYDEARTLQFHPTCFSIEEKSDKRFSVLIDCEVFFKSEVDGGVFTSRRIDDDDNGELFEFYIVEGLFSYFHSVGITVNDNDFYFSYLGDQVRITIKLD